MNIAIILAGGVGNRFGAGIPKQFVNVMGKPILAYSIDAFENHPDIDAILVVCVEPYIETVWKFKESYGFTKLKWVTAGGSTFQESVQNGVSFLSDKANEDDIVIFHFGASPFIKADIITDVINVCHMTKTNAISATDYLLLSGKKKKTTSVSDQTNYTDEYIDRDTIAVMNTPHAFRYGYVVEMYREAVDSGVIDTVEPHTTTLMYAMNRPIYFAKGSQGNIKITTKEDLELFEGYVLAQQRKTTRQVSADVVVFFADGFEECEALIVVDLLRRAGLATVMASITGQRDVKSSRSILVNTDCLVENINFTDAKMVVLPGGRTGVDNLNKNDYVRELCKHFAKDKAVAAICAAPSILASLGLLEHKKATVHPDYLSRMNGAICDEECVVVSENIITAQGLGAAFPFSFEIIRMLVGEEMVSKIKKDICYKD